MDTTNCQALTPSVATPVKIRTIDIITMKGIWFAPITSCACRGAPGSPSEVRSYVVQIILNGRNVHNIKFRIDMKRQQPVNWRNVRPLRDRVRTTATRTGSDVKGGRRRRTAACRPGAARIPKRTPGGARHGGPCPGAHECRNVGG